MSSREPFLPYNSAMVPHHMTSPRTHARTHAHTHTHTHTHTEHKAFPTTDMWQCLNIKRPRTPKIPNWTGKEFLLYCFANTGWKQYLYCSCTMQQQKSPKIHTTLEESTNTYDTDKVNSYTKWKWSKHKYTKNRELYTNYSRYETQSRAPRLEHSPKTSHHIDLYVQLEHEI